MTENKRKHTRVRSLNLLYVGVYEKDVLVKQGIGRTLDVSESGIRLETHFPIDPKNIVQLAIGLKDELVDIKGRAVHTVTGRSGKYKIGIRFNRIKKSSLEIVKKYITAFSKYRD
ncbi:MAG: PilZ domain-containing protein [Desulfobacterales bacterium]|nr:PilZ domain-containing protein [Desulfobacterales bacterium]